MVNEGVILEVKKNHIIVLSKDGDYMKLKYKDGSIEGQRIYFTNEDVQKEKRYTRLSAIAACILIILIPAFIFMSMPANINNVYAAAVVSVDINPSIEFMIDNNGNVIDMNFLDKDAQELADKKWKGEPYSEVIVKYLNAAEKKGYIHENGVVLFACTVLDDTLDSNIIEENTVVAVSQIEKNVSYTYAQVNKDTLKKAREEKVSLGKYDLYKEILEKNPKLELQKFKKEEIKEIIKETRNIVKQNRKEDKSEEKNQNRLENTEVKRKNDEIKNKEENQNKNQINQNDNDIPTNKDIKGNNGKDKGKEAPKENRETTPNGNSNDTGGKNDNNNNGRKN